jgi:hypothetical protein
VPAHLGINGVAFDDDSFDTESFSVTSWLLIATYASTSPVIYVLTYDIDYYVRDKIDGVHVCGDYVWPSMT